VDRTQEHLGTTDVAVIAARRRLSKMAHDLPDGSEPVEVLRPEICNVRGRFGVPGKRLFPRHGPLRR
jgi:hypothetical protein